MLQVDAYFSSPNKFVQSFFYNHLYSCLNVTAFFQWKKTLFTNVSCNLPPNERPQASANASSSVWCTALQFTHFDVGLRLLFSLRHQEFVRVENEVKNVAKTKTFTKFSLACTVRSCSYTIPWSQYGNRGFACMYCCV